MKPLKLLAVAAGILAPVVLASVAFTQEDPGFQAREQNFREYVTLLRTDLKAQRKSIITQLMELDQEDAAAFWPIFEQYDAELTQIGKGREDLIVEYAKHYDSLTDEKADALMSRAFELEAQRAMLKKKYFDKMKTAISATQATRFFLIENQIQHIIDLQVSAMLPTVQTASN
jgi:hypothetical protein